MMIGKYPFRCLDCRERVWINIWLLSKHKRATCPRCLTLDVSPANTQTMRLGLWGKLLTGLGARGFYCAHCRRRFLTFKLAAAHRSAFAAPAETLAGAQPATTPASAGQEMASVASVGK